MSAPVEWDAGEYDRLADPQEEWARDVVARLALAGDEYVLDAGCGGGRVTRQLLDRLPRGRVLGVDGSEAMVERARDAIGADPRVELRVADLCALELEQAVDAVFSNATFHWIPDHDLLFARLFAALRPGGRIEAQCGGEGNVAAVAQALAKTERDPRFAGYIQEQASVWNFATVADTRSRLDAVGFEVGDVWIENKTTTPEEPREFTRVMGMAKHLAQLPTDLHADFIDQVMAALPSPLVLRYVRLNISARRPQ